MSAPVPGTALVTGAARGIGRATAVRLLAGGWRVVAGVRDVAAARADLPADPRLAVVRLDVTDAEQVRAGVAEAERLAEGALGAVVNNAGWALMGAVEDVDLARARDMFETNFFGAAAVLQAALPAMREARAGVVVGVSSIGARISNPLLGMYHASKYALTALHEALAVEMAPFGVRVVTVEPGMVETEFPKATTPTGSVADPDGPYAPLLGELRAGFGEWRRRHGIGAEEVAEAIAAAIADPAAPFRVEVGEDTRILGGARERLADREFHAELLGFLGVRAWPDEDGAAGR